MKRKVFFIGEHVQHARVKVLEVISPPEDAGHDAIRYIVECNLCGKKRTLAHSTLRQRVADRALACVNCTRSQVHGVEPPNWPVPPMLAKMPRGWER